MKNLLNPVPNLQFSAALHYVVLMCNATSLLSHSRTRSCVRVVRGVRGESNVLRDYGSGHDLAAGQGLALL